MNVWYDWGWSLNEKHEFLQYKYLFWFTSSYLGNPTYSSILNVTTCSKLNSPDLWKSTNLWYTPIGEDPVGNPKTNGLSTVGLNWLIRSFT
jgi:hypothetical protein